MPRWLRGWLGDRGERAARRYLRRLGYSILARDWRSRLGQIDLVALDGDVVVFVEVKTRSGTEAGLPAEAVTPAKQRQLSRLALQFLKRYHLLDKSARFDVLAVTWPPGQRSPRIEHIRNAFECTGDFGMYG
jgi:putative endonuclease